MDLEETLRTGYRYGADDVTKEMVEKSLENTPVGMRLRLPTRMNYGKIITSDELDRMHEEEFSKPLLHQKNIFYRIFEYIKKIYKK